MLASTITSALHLLRGGCHRLHAGVCRGCTLAVAYSDLRVVLRGHARAHRAPHYICGDVDRVGGGVDTVNVHDDRHTAHNAREVLQRNHGGDDALVAGGRLELQVVLQQPARDGHRVGEADPRLEEEAALGARFLAALARAREVATTTDVLAHVALVVAAADLPRGAARAAQSKAKAARVGARRVKQISVPLSGEAQAPLRRLELVRDALPRRVRHTVAPHLARLGHGLLLGRGGAGGGARDGDALMGAARHRAGGDRLAPPGGAVSRARSDHGEPPP
mmetsp:Transcript_20337/g.63056  ORF Transcript_20337/g.63056 Transcript_20337/m.63056 type:complete len:278 (+) Transcript_20337:363-1196(+)